MTAITPRRALASIGLALVFFIPWKLESGPAAKLSTTVCALPESNQTPED